MTENGKKFIEQASKDAKLQEVMRATQLETILEVANANGYNLTAEDFAADAKAEELSEDEMMAVAGGGKCACAFYGGGGGDGLVCACTTGGEGVDGKHHLIKDCKCVCVIAGAGIN
ncbi:MAG: Nif11-like leader peptide family RiPP precursor [Synergistaceae bacterium]|nr:Nif11-like leader peptide family RiPP precursor [Synergistaceae bacterium]